MIAGISAKKYDELVRAARSPGGKLHRKFWRVYHSAKKSEQAKMMADVERHTEFRKTGFPISASELGDPAVFWAMVERGVGCWSIKGRPLAKHQAVSLNGMRYLAHRVAYALAHGETPSLLVCHVCDLGGCVNPEHLFIGTHADNMQDMTRKGRHGKRGLSNWNKFLLEFHPDRLTRHVVKSIEKKPSLAQLLK